MLLRASFSSCRWGLYRHSLASPGPACDRRYRCVRHLSLKLPPEPVATGAVGQTFKVDPSLLFRRAFLLWTLSLQNPPASPTCTPVSPGGGTSLKRSLVLSPLHPTRPLSSHPKSSLVHPCFSALGGHLNLQLQFRAEASLPLQPYLSTSHRLLARYRGQMSKVIIQKRVIWVGGENGPPASLTLAPAPPGSHPRNSEHNSRGR